MNSLSHKDSPGSGLPATPSITTKTSQANAAWEEPVSFPEWHEILALEPLDAQTRAHYAQAIIVYLGYCEASHERASIAGAKRYLDGGTQRGRPDASARAGLRWFFTAYRRCRGSDRKPGNRPPSPSLPVSTVIPPGTPSWEADLIRRIRLRGFLWNTEQAYRAWMNRFAAKVAPATPDQTGAPEVREFLTALAIQKVSASTQRQALNALVFYFREGLERDLGDLGDFRRARRGPRIPVVLSRAELDRFFAQLKGTWLLMAQLQYGSGLRITELVELRVQSLDLDRNRVLVFGGKGDKDRATVLATPLVPRLRAQLDRLRGLFADDRKNNAPPSLAPAGHREEIPGRRRPMAMAMAVPDGGMVARSADGDRSPASRARRKLSTRDQGGHATRCHRQTGDTSCASTLLCHASAGGGCRHPHRSRVARSCQR